MKIAFVHDMRFEGGAEQSARFLFTKAPPKIQLGVVTDWTSLKEHDGAILSGLEFMQRHRARHILEYVLDHEIPYVVWDHHVNLGNLTPGDWHTVFRYAKKIFFMSPNHHRRRRVNFEGVLYEQDIVELPVGIDTSFFNPRHVPRQIGKAVCMMTRMNSKDHKVWEFARENPTLDIDVYDYARDPKLPNVKILGPVSRSTLPEIYSSASHHIDLPGRPTAGGNATYESILCECKPIVNDFVGAASWPWKWDNPDVLREKIKSGNRRFWDEIVATFGESE